MITIKDLMKLEVKDLSNYLSDKEFLSDNFTSSDILEFVLWLLNKKEIGEHCFSILGNLHHLVRDRVIFILTSKPYHKEDFPINAMWKFIAYNYQTIEMINPHRFVSFLEYSFGCTRLKHFKNYFENLVEDLNNPNYWIDVIIRSTDSYKDNLSEFIINIVNPFGNYKYKSPIAYDRLMTFIRNNFNPGDKWFDFFEKNNLEY